MEQLVVVFAGALAGGMIVLGLLRRGVTGGSRSQQGELATQLSVVCQQLEHLAERVGSETSILTRRLEGIDSR